MQLRCNQMSLVTWTGSPYLMQGKASCEAAHSWPCCHNCSGTGFNTSPYCCHKWSTQTPTTRSAQISPDQPLQAGIRPCPLTGEGGVSQ